MSYNSESIRVLKGLEACRKRPGMYIGNVHDGSGYHHMLYEVMDNSIDENLAGHCKEIKVTLDKFGYATVEDDGRGIPIDIHKEEGISAAVVIMTQLHAGGKFDQDSYKVSGGLHGVGVSVVNALSANLELTIWRDGYEHFARFEKGDLVEDIRVVGKSKKTGTKVRFIPDTEIFQEIHEFNLKTISNRLEELAFLNPTLRIHLIDERESFERFFHEEKGIVAFVEDMAKNKECLNPIISFKKEQDNISVTGSLVWTQSYSEEIRCFTNTIPQKEGGTHLVGLKTGLTRSINNYIQKEDLLSKKTKDLQISGDDIREGLVCVLSVHVPEPQFASQTKEKLVSASVRPVAELAVTEACSAWLEENPVEAKKIIQRILDAAAAREAARKARDLTRKNKNAGEFSLSMAHKLAGCSEKDPTKTELFIVEGDSAGGSAKMARDRTFQAVLPLRGKILNVEKASFDRMLNYEGIRTLIAALGTGIGETFDITKIRYNKIIIMTDADIDGSHILTLILTFFFRYMKPVIENGYIYVAQPPLYGVKQGQNMHYLLNDRSLADFLLDRTLDKIKLKKDEQEIEPKEIKEFIRALFQTAKDISKRGILFEAMLLAKNTNIESGEELLPSLQILRPGNWEVKLNNNIFDYTYEKNGLIQKYELNLNHMEQSFPSFIEKWSHLWGSDILLEYGSDIRNATNPMEIYNIFSQKSSSGLVIQRYKGLGEMNPEDLARTAMKDYLQVDYEDVDELINQLMGDNPEERRDFLARVWDSLEADD
jgi:DNA gyrase subunit B